MVRYAYDLFREDLRKAVASERAAARIEKDENGKHSKALTALSNLWELLEEDIPTMHDYFCYLKVSRNLRTATCIVVW